MSAKSEFINIKDVRDAVRNKDDAEFVIIMHKDFQAPVDADKLKHADFVEHFQDCKAGSHHGVLAAA